MISYYDYESYLFINYKIIIPHMSIVIEEQQERLQQSTSDKIKAVRLQKEIEYLKSLNRKYTIVNRHEIIIEKIIHDQLNLHIYIPEEYPFKEPLYAVSNRLDVREPVSVLIDFWVPNVKILELVELLANVINKKEDFSRKVEHYILLKPFYQEKAVTLIIVLAILLRILVGLGTYSGAGDYPNYGDFQAHRNWMSITVNRDINTWYEQFDANPWWRIDYPPVAAYISYFFGAIYRTIEPESMQIQKGYQSPSLKSYMRFTVLTVDVFFLFVAILLLKSNCNKLTRQLFLLIILLKPDLILIDHGHFQYNSLILGLILLAFYCILQQKFYYSCFFYTIALFAKQMASYYSLAFFAALIGFTYQKYMADKTRILIEYFKYGLIVIIVALIIWSPWLGSLQQLQTVLTAIFPVHRGLYQLKVPNFWCISDIIMKWEHHFTKTTLLFFCIICSIIGSLPSMIYLIVRPSRKTLAIPFATIAMTFFMFSYHVHEKSILLPLLLLPFINLNLNFIHDVIMAGCLGMFHLLKEDGQQTGYFAIMVIYYLFQRNYVNLKNETFEQSKLQERSQVLKYHKIIYENRYMRWLFISVVITLHINEKFMTPPANLPYLHHLLFAFFSFLFNAYFLIFGNLLQIEELVEWMKEKSKKKI